MKSLILYGSVCQLSNSHRLVTGHQQPAYYVRAELFNGSLDEALAQASPYPVETVLNTVPCPEDFEFPAVPQRTEDGQLNCLCGRTTNTNHALGTCIDHEKPEGSPVTVESAPLPVTQPAGNPRKEFLLQFENAHPLGLEPIPPRTEG